MTEASEKFEVTAGGGKVRGALLGPAKALERAPAVLICRGVLMPDDDAHGLFDDLTLALNHAGFAVARFDHRCADLILDDFDVHCAAHDVEDAAAVFEWLAARPDVDRARLGVIGYSLGAITAAALAGRTDRIVRLALIAAATAEHVRTKMLRSNGSPATINPELLPAAFVPSLASVDSPGNVVVNDRPTLVLHGAADRFVPAEVSMAYVEALEQAQRQVEHVLVARADHTFDSPSIRTGCLERITRFFGAMLEPA